MSRFEALDTYLASFDPESMDWHEYAYEIAVEKLAVFDPIDWQELRDVWRERPRAWRMCLATVLEPRHSSVAGELLLAAIDDPDAEISFEALTRTYFYCGVLTVKGAVLINPKIQVPLFLGLARASQTLPAQASRHAEQSSAHFRSEIEVFIRLLEAKAV